MLYIAGQFTNIFIMRSTDLQYEIVIDILTHEHVNVLTVTSGIFIQESNGRKIHRIVHSAGSSVNYLVLKSAWFFIFQFWTMSFTTQFLHFEKVKCSIHLFSSFIFLYYDFRFSLLNYILCLVFVIYSDT